MKVFIIGLPNSGRTTIAKALSEQEGYLYIDAMTSMKTVFANNFSKEDLRSQAYHEFIMDAMRANANVFSNYVTSIENTCLKSDNIVIDGVFSPKDFATLFNYMTDVVVFVNRLDNKVEYQDYENIGISVSRDYCFWLSSVGLLPKNRWLEYNFKISGEDSDRIKTLGSKNTVYIIKSIDRVIEHLREQLAGLNEVS